MLMGLGLAPAWLDIQPFPFLVPCGDVSITWSGTPTRLPSSSWSTDSERLEKTKAPVNGHRKLHSSGH